MKTNKHKRTPSQSKSSGKVLIADDVNTEKIAEMTQGYSGSELRTLCTNAFRLPIREFLHSTYPRQRSVSQDNVSTEKTPSPDKRQRPRAVCHADFVAALQVVRPEFLGVFPTITKQPASPSV